MYQFSYIAEGVFFMKHIRQSGFVFRLAAALLLMLAVTGAACADTFTCIVPEGQYVNVRKQPSGKAATWGVMRTGETIEADPSEIRNGFFKFTFMDREAYVSVRYFEIEESRDYTVSANGRVRVRKSPGGEACGFVQPGDTVRVRAWQRASDGSLWARCPGPKYISAAYLVPEG